MSSWAQSKSPASAEFEQISSRHERKSAHLWSRWSVGVPWWRSAAWKWSTAARTSPVSPSSIWHPSLSKFASSPAARLFRIKSSFHLIFSEVCTAPSKHNSSYDEWWRAEMCLRQRMLEKGGIIFVVVLSLHASCPHTLSATLLYLNTLFSDSDLFALRLESKRRAKVRILFSGFNLSITKAQHHLLVHSTDNFIHFRFTSSFFLYIHTTESEFEIVGRSFDSKWG